MPTPSSAGVLSTPGIRDRLHAAVNGMALLRPLARDSDSWAHWTAEPSGGNAQPPWYFPLKSAG